MAIIARKFLIRGIVQGVGFRYFVQRLAAKHQVSGYVRNLPDGRVEAHAQGDENVIEAFGQDLAAGPAYSRVDEVEELVIDIDAGYSSFRIEK
jgi:acylphosphatase